MKPEEVKLMNLWIASASYEDLLRKWWFAPHGDPFLSGETGNYYAAEMKRKRELTGDDGRAASEAVGWEA